MKKKSRWNVPRSTLRERLQRRVGKKEDPWCETEAEDRRIYLEKLPGQFLRQMNEHLFQKSVAAILVVILLGLFNLYNTSVTNRMVDTVHYFTVHQVGPAELAEQIQPVIKVVRDFEWRPSQQNVAPEGEAESTMAAPVNGVLISPFGTRQDLSGERTEMHYGIDVAAEEGSPVYAAFSGTISLVQEHPQYGMTIYIEHEEALVTIYARCAEIEVTAGDFVRRGEQIAVVAPALTGQNRLHFEIWKEGQPVDPQVMLGENL